jgi:hypothetical protein
VRAAGIAIVVALAAIDAAQPSRIHWEWMHGPLSSPVTRTVHQNRLLLLAPEAAWISPDEGRTWHRPPDRRLASTLHLAATPTELFRAEILQIERSADGARSWQACSPLPVDLRGGSVSGITGDVRHVYVSGRGLGLVRSSDRCASWHKLAGPWSAEVTPIVSFARGDSVIVRAGTMSFLSLDAGRTWTSIDVPEALAFEKYCDAGLVAGTARGAYVSWDDGRTWIPAGLAGRWVPALTAPQCGLVYAAVKDEGRWTYTVMQSRDAGKHWSAAADGLPPHPIYALTSSSRGQVYASGAAGAFRRSTFAARWQQFGPAEVPVVSIIAAPWQTVLAATGDALLTRSMAGGPWRMVLLGHDAHLSAHHPVSSAQALVVAADGGLLVSGRQGVLRSADRGETWRRVGLPYPASAFATADRGRAILAATDAGVFRATDGQIWTDWSRGLSQRNIVSVSGSSGRTVYAGTRSGEVFTATIDADMWTVLPPLPGAVQALLATRNGSLLAGTPFGSFRLRNGDATWLPIPVDGAPALKMVRALVQHPDGAVLAATDGLGIFVSFDDGTSWRPANQGLSVARVLSLAVGADGDLYAGTSEGAFRGAM